MSDIAMSVANMVEMLPEADQSLAYEIVKKLVLAWDPDFTKVTPKEARELEKAEASGFLSEEEIDWDHLDEMKL